MKINNIYKFVIIVLLIIVVKSGIAQQLYINNLYNQCNYIINPSLAGSKGYTEAFLNSRNQWIGLEGAPKTTIVGIHTALKKNSGLGFILVNDRSHLIQNNSGAATYSYKLNLSKNVEHSLRLGLSAGFVEKHLNLANVNADDRDPILTSDLYDGIAFDASFGINYNLYGLNIGAAFPQLLDNDLRYQINSLADDYKFMLNRHLMFHASYTFKIRKKKFDNELKESKSKNVALMVIPSVLYKSLPNYPEQIDYSLLFVNKKNHWLGAIYRPSLSSVVFMAGINIFKNYNLGYAYEYSTDGMASYTAGTHEIMIRFDLTRKAVRKADSRIIHIMEGNQEKILEDIEDLKKNFDEKHNSILDSLQAQLSSLKESKGSNYDEQLEAMKNELLSLRDKVVDGTITGIELNEIDKLLGQIEKLQNPEEQKELSEMAEEIEYLKKEIEKLKQRQFGSQDNISVDSLKMELDNLKQYIKNFVNENVVELKKDSNGDYLEEDIRDGCYIIIHAFRNFEGAKRAVRIEKSKGVNSSIIHNKDRGWYYIYIKRFDELNDALPVMRNERKNSEHTDAWVHIYKNN
ncbi:MAG: PorP/SprF family type IX secretion system membrane protein [Bacteroidetes bacterium]|jgi:type IX secretion system PorP/SprF family membrane protein|nr:PorP/SprF family type IX secretion system membrane protein [Bacteroidota bacterium]MBT6685265.1 PorP/SprF family type IX secretion system membrane protein [Bacteroidota bacterium]MBT7144030.1 PorP/SprF family type IX secretion system membrane protein [Bacteroidota bacterium]MBT7491843.1 PorP/SprF family type IX secretion system membrane protein [Bacteroidota bacterium]